MEEWRSVAGYAGYEISSHGRLRRNGNILSAYVEPSGYCQFTLCADGKSRKRRAHNIVVEAFIAPDKKPLHCVNHIDFNKSNNHVENLEYVTYGANNKHTYRHGRKPRPTGQARLKDEDVLSIYQLAHKRETTNPEVGKMFGISAAEVSLIKVGLRWQHLTGHRRSA